MEIDHRSIFSNSNGIEDDDLVHLGRTEGIILFIQDKGNISKIFF